MQEKPVIFIAFLEQDNLGVGYVASMLINHEIDVKILDFRLGEKEILKQIIYYDPVVVGFSIIFQYHIEEFKDLINYLRLNGIKSHFNAGGHYPSLRFNDLLEYIPRLDSVTLFEGEYTFLELVRNIYSEKNWKDIVGIAYEDHGSIIENKLRPLEKDLDSFPPPIRQPLREFAFDKKYTTIIAGRGCYYNCAFCSIREFYSKPPGPVKRFRRPEMVIREMELLHHEMDCSIFMFQDDDFPVASKFGKEWVTTFCDLLDQKGLSGKILWKISCRPDEIDPDLFKLMKNKGLFLVYLGIEAGTNKDLLFMNKRMDIESAMRSVEILKDLNIRYDFGFMLLHPASTFESIHRNLDFLRHICSDGSSPISFCKMLPYAETKIEYELKKDGRIIGDPGFENYEFLNPRLNEFSYFLSNCFQDWIGKHDGLVNAAKWSRYYSTVYSYYHSTTEEIILIDKEISECIAESNIFLLSTIKSLLHLFETPTDQKGRNEELLQIKMQVKEKNEHYTSILSGSMIKIENIFVNSCTEPQIG